MPSENFLLIKEAVEKKQQIQATYGGYFREMSPHVLGYKKGSEHVLCVQFGGDSSKGKITVNTRDWKCVDISKLRDLRVTPGTFYDKETSGESRQTCIDEVVACVQK